MATLSLFLPIALLAAWGPAQATARYGSGRTAPGRQPSWRGVGGTLAVLLLVAAVAAPPRPADTVSLPLRVYPPDGRSEHVESITLRVDAPASVDSLYVRAHQPFNARTGWNRGVSTGRFEPEGAAALRLNGGDWTPVRDATVDCAWPEGAYGCVAGVYHTLRFTVPVEGVRAGANTLAFRYNGTKGVRSGYRVLGVGFMRPSDPTVQRFDPLRHGAHDTAQLVREKVAGWQPPAGFRAPSSIQAGKQLWNETGRLRDIDGTDLRASCGACHATNGRDLQYFGYSNRVIVARSRAHGLSVAEGKQIAAYIRTHALEGADGTSYAPPGRPWNPPYQPGPRGFGPRGAQGPDQAPPHYWAAGAGLDWVLDHPREAPGTERDMLAHLFPKNGDPSQGVDWHRSAATGTTTLNWRHVSADSTLSLRSVPLALQFPDWNSWLPKIHPMDAVPDAFLGGAGRRWYRDALPAAVGSRNLNATETATRRMKAELRRDGVLKHDRPPGFTANKWALSRAGAYKWLAVKYWETFHGHHLEDRADEAYPTWSEPRGWIGRQRIPFDLAGHISAPTGQQSPPWIYANEAQEKAFSHLWYQVQMVLNPGTQPASSHQTPVDLGYQRSHIGDIAAHFAPPADYRRFLTEIKAWQRWANGDLADPARGWNANASRVNVFGRMDLPTARLNRALHTAGMRAWWHEMRQFAPNAFPRGPENEWYEPEDAVPEPTGFTSNRAQGQQTYQYLVAAAEQNLLPATLIDSIGTLWGQPLWPHTGVPPFDDRPRWDALAAPTVRQSISLETGWNFVSAYVAPPDSSIEQIVAGVDGLSMVKDEDGRVYMPGQGIDQIETWSPSEGYKVHVTTDAVLTLSGRPLYASKTPIPLEKGWNLVPFYPRTPMDAATALAPIQNVLNVARNEAGRTYAPSQPRSPLDTLRPGAAYALYVSADTTLTYPRPQ